jgi:hypothetical protein
MTVPRYDGTPVRRTFDSKGDANGFNVMPNSEWDAHDLVLWTLSLVNTETGLSIGAQGPDKDGKYTLTAEFLNKTFPSTDVSGVTTYLMGVLSGYIGASHGFGVLGSKPAPSAAFSTMFGGLFR